MNPLQIEIIAQWQDESGRGLRPEFSGRCLTADGTLTEDAMAIFIPRAGHAKHRWHTAAGCFLTVLDDIGAPIAYLQTTNPPAFDVSGGYVEAVEAPVVVTEIEEVAPEVVPDVVPDAPPTEPVAEPVVEPVAEPPVLPEATPALVMDAAAETPPAP